MNTTTKILCSIVITCISSSAVAENTEFTVSSFINGKADGTVLLNQSAFDKRLEKITKSSRLDISPAARCVSLFVAKRTQASLSMGIVSMSKNSENMINELVKTVEARNKRDAVSCKVKISTLTNV